MFLFSCKNGDNRNKLEFFTSPKEVENSMLEIYELLVSYPNYDNVMSYGFDNNNSFYINSKLQYELNEDFTIIKMYDSDTSLFDLNQSILEKAVFLKKNYISGGYYDNQIETFFYEYKTTQENSYCDLLYLVINPPNDTIDFTTNVETFIQIDKLGNIFLTKPLRK